MLEQFIVYEPMNANAQLHKPYSRVLNLSEKRARVILNTQYQSTRIIGIPRS